MDSLLILIQLEVLIQLKKIMFRNFIIQYPIFQFIIDSWTQITRMYILPRIFH